MRYQDILKGQLSRRTNVNPQYSLRAFAKNLGLAPSKLSEILSKKKGISFHRAEDLCDRLRIDGIDREIFLLSVQAQHARIKKVRNEASEKLKELLLAKKSYQGQTARKNAWYFGAVKAVLNADLPSEKILRPLQLTVLQVESAERFVDLLQKSYPEKKRFTYDSGSLMRKINDDFSADAIQNLDASFAFLSEEQATTLSRLIQLKIAEFEEANAQEKKLNLYMFFNGFSKLCSKEQIC